MQTKNRTLSLAPMNIARTFVRVSLLAYLAVGAWVLNFPVGFAN